MPERGPPAAPRPADHRGAPARQHAREPCDNDGIWSAGLQLGERPGRAPVKGDQLVGLFTGEPTASGELVKAPPLAGMPAEKGVQVHSCAPYDLPQLASRPPWIRHTRVVTSPRLGIVAGEAVAIELPRAGLGSRTIAASIDLVLQFVALIIALMVDSTLAGDDAALAAAVIVELVLILAGYPILSEWLGHGRTLGKLAMGLRVVRDDGGPIAFRQAFTRGLTGLVMEKPGLLGPITTALGMITLASSPASKRIGDHLAGTFVINERVGTRATALTPPAHVVPWQLQAWAAALDLTRLDDHLALSVRQFVARANELDPGARFMLENDLANRVAAVIAPPPPFPIAAPTLLVTVLAERRRRAEWSLHR